MNSIFELQSYIDAIEKNIALYEEKNFDQRIDVIDFIEFQVMDQAEDLLRKTAQQDQLNVLKHRAEQLKAELEAIDINLFQKLQANLQTFGNAGKEFKDLMSVYFHLNTNYKERQAEPGYDNMDIFINRLFPFQQVPEQTKTLEPDMIYYQKTPVRIVFEMVDCAHFRKEDVFFDIGAGLGLTAILVHLLTRIAVKGIEFEPAFCEYANKCARSLNLSNVTFNNIDARKAGYSEGTVFFMFTPFKADMLQEVLEMLRKESLKRKIKVITYGPCTPEVALQSWLNSADLNNDNIYKLGLFTSF